MNGKRIDPGGLDHEAPAGVSYTAKAGDRLRCEYAGNAKRPMACSLRAGMTTLSSSSSSEGKAVCTAVAPR